MEVTIRKFTGADIKNKVRWINNPENNQFLHYDLPLEYEKTCDWYEKIKDRTDRYDAVIETDKKPVGLVGLLSVDGRNQKAEYYVLVGEKAYRGRGIALKATLLLLDFAFSTLGLKKIYLYTETENISAQHLFQKAGFQKEGLLKNDLLCRGKYVDRFVYGITEEEYQVLLKTGQGRAMSPWAALNQTASLQEHSFQMTPVQFLGDISGNSLYIKREDLIPYCFGGNKARKGRLFFEEIKKGGYDCVVTYGGSHSNHCRVVANMAAQRGLPCSVIRPDEVSDITFNEILTKIFGAKIIYSPIGQVHDVIERNLTELKGAGRKPYFIPGGGHGNTGTQAYVNCYKEILDYENKNGMHFDYIFLASGTGTTQAGLICGQLINGDERKIVGISIARKNPRGRNVVTESVREYLRAEKISVGEDALQGRTVFLDDYVGGGYGKENRKIKDAIKNAMIHYGIPFDSTYTGKAFWGMTQYLQRKKLEGKNILFLHTGGTPLFFDDVENWECL